MNNRLVSVIVVSLLAWGMSFVPFKIVSCGFLPLDDALRHSAKIISGKEWKDILVLRKDVGMDSHPGWHAMLGAVQKVTRWDALGLVIFSVVFLFLVYSLVPLFLLRRPEGWILSFIALCVANPNHFQRFLLGRPYIIFMTSVLIIGISWPRLRQVKLPYKTMFFLTAAIALSTWIHCGWYLFFIPLLSFFIARQWRAGIRMSVVIAAGIALGSLLTGHPVLFLQQTANHVFLAFGGNVPVRARVSEFAPFLGDLGIVWLAAMLVTWRALRGKWDRKIIDNPLFIMAALCWVIGFFTERMWLDCGIASLMCWMAYEFQDILESAIPENSARRIGAALLIVALAFTVMTSDAFGRYSESAPREYLFSENSLHAGLLPGPGGIIYSDDMLIFYSTFFKNPHGQWRYVLGFEPGLMRPEDLAIYRNIRLNYGACFAFDPWVKKMRPEDRLVVRHNSDTPPKINGLEWKRATGSIWVGRLR